MFILNRKQREEKQNGRSTYVIRIKFSTLAIVEKLAEESGHSKREIMDRAIKYAYENLQWEEE